LALYTGQGHTRPRARARARMAGDGRDEQLKLLGAWPSPFLHRVRVALHLKGLEYEYVEEDIFNKSELLLASNPVHKKVPVLLHGDRPIPESKLIVQYLDDAFPGAGQAILPADPYDRAVARFWAAYVDDKLHPPIIASLKATTEEEKASATANTFTALETLEGAFAELSGGKGFFGGDAPGYVDVALGGFISWLRAWDKLFGVTLLDAGRIPLLSAWAQRFAALDAAKGVLPDVDPIVEFGKFVTVNFLLPTPEKRWLWMLFRLPMETTTARPSGAASARRGGSRDPPLLALEQAGSAASAAPETEERVTEAHEKEWRVARDKRTGATKRPGGGPRGEVGARRSGLAGETTTQAGKATAKPRDTLFVYWSGHTRPGARARMAGGGRDEQLKLLGAWPSPFLHRVRVALHLKGLEYEYVEEDLTNKSELLLASNPVHKKVPVLHGDRPIPESLVIVQYLDDAFPGAGQAILPADPYDRAVARFWAAYIDDKFFPAMITSLKATTEEERTAGTANTFAALETLEGAFAKLSEGKGFFAGDAPGYVDVALGGFVAWLRAWDKLVGVTLLDAGRIPLLAAWAQRFAALDAAKEVLPNVDPLLEFAKVLQAQWAAAAAHAPASN
ncbi:hypothetical protein EJB05_15908, partial [Eragrostis curvula]